MEVIYDAVFKTFLSNPQILLIIFFLIIIYAVVNVYYPDFRGYMGELLVKRKLNKLPKDKYIILNNIMIKDKKGSHQIDHLIISEFGIFVIETKNYYGLIKGKEIDNKWCQYLGKNKNYFFNPIHQNYGHIKAVSNLLGLDDKFFISIICFSNQAKVDVKCKTTVTQVDYLVNEILKYTKPIIKQNIKEIAQTILSNNIVDKEIRKQHVKNINAKYVKYKK